MDARGYGRCLAAMNEDAQILGVFDIINRNPMPQLTAVGQARPSGSPAPISVPPWNARLAWKAEPSACVAIANLLPGIGAPIGTAWSQRLQYLFQNLFQKKFRYLIRCV